MRHLWQLWSVFDCILTTLWRWCLVVGLGTRLWVGLGECCWLSILSLLLLMILDILHFRWQILLWRERLLTLLNNLWLPLWSLYILIFYHFILPKFELNFSTWQPLFQISNHIYFIYVICLFLFIYGLYKHSCYLLQIVIEIFQLYFLWNLLYCLKLCWCYEDVLIWW